MKYFNATNNLVFNLVGTNYQSDKLLSRLSLEDIEYASRVNKNISYLGKNTAGMQLRFKTDSKKIIVRVKLASASNMNHMSSLGQSGLDLYVYNDKLSEYVFHKSTTYDQSLTEFEFELASFKENKTRKIIINLPLYNSLEKLEIGLEDSSNTEPIFYDSKDNIVIYGTSIVQGGCVSRPGMLYSNIISRKINNEIFNFGFSGSAFCEIELAVIIRKVNNPKVLIVDAQPNAGIDNRLIENLPGFIEKYREFHKNTAILICSRIKYAADLYDQEIIKQDKKNRRFLKAFVKEKSLTDPKIFYVDGSKVFKGNFTEYTVDGVHPNDYGSVSLADYYYKQIKKYL